MLQFFAENGRSELVRGLGHPGRRGGRGFGAAGACAALEAAAAGCSVLVLDRFAGGGATSLSGGVVYAGGGTPQQHAAGVTDSAEAMFGYLRTEVRRRGAGRDASRVLRRQHGDARPGWRVTACRSRARLCPDKTSYPTNRHYLYYSGSEVSARAAAPPAPRGHRARGRGTSGGLLFARLAGAVRRAGVQVADADRGGAPDDGRRAGDRRRVPHAARRAGWAVTAHRVLHRLARKPYLYVPKAGRVMHRPVGWLERRYAPADCWSARTAAWWSRRAVSARARSCCARTRRPRAAACRWRRRATTAAASGSGTGAGGAAGSSTAFRCGGSSARRPPCCAVCWWTPDGKRICDESRYGAAIGDEIVRRGGRAWLLADRATIAAAPAAAARLDALVPAAAGAGSCWRPGG